MQVDSEDTVQTTLSSGSGDSRSESKDITSSQLSEAGTSMDITEAIQSIKMTDEDTSVEMTEAHKSDTRTEAGTSDEVEEIQMEEADVPSVETAEAAMSVDIAQPGTSGKRADARMLVRMEEAGPSYRRKEIAKKPLDLSNRIFIDHAMSDQQVLTCGSPDSDGSEQSIWNKLPRYKKDER